ncbi:unnamed protein product (macronuclear) [Paramecium tetraurelia]|uniref:Ubiquitin-like domain-containing protein n=1 Tax=Paramecium tetraurelia TaxID=5888 RepID=A0D842_PARTE|nr:uncharacterized protein GSPATT00014176001 [Paramecium tetraurelia]CAK79209.1 unnamed protein product [Paramecium tetraurelia]|eukprot:XP_001446606.1 hypothetical protein (macronuclear) [Paramecium tetraurelia strain d4-2]
MVELDFGDVIEYKIVSFSQFNTIKELKENLQNYYNKQSKFEQINIEIYKDHILQTNEKITIYKLLDLDKEIKQPKIEAKSITQNQQNQEPNDKTCLNKQQFGKLQSDSQILQELQLLKELINSKFKILELQLTNILADSQKTILKELEFYERDFTQNQQLLKQSFINNPDWIYQKYKSFRIYNKVCQAHVQSIFVELEKFESNLQKEQEQITKLYESGSIQSKNLMKEQQYTVGKKNKLTNNNFEIEIEIEIDTTFSEIIEYLESQYPSEFKQYIQVFGPIQKWVGFSTKRERVVSISEKMCTYPVDIIKVGPFHINIPKIINNLELKVEIYELKNQHQV